MTKKKADPYAGAFLPEPFITKEQIFRFLDVVESGASYLGSIVSDDNADTLLSQATMSYSQIVSDEVGWFREKIFGEQPALLNKWHPAFDEMCDAAAAVAREAQKRHRASEEMPKTKTAPIHQGKASAN